MSSSLSKVETMANRRFKIPQVTVQRGFWNPATVFTYCVSLALCLKEGLMKRSGEAFTSHDAQESLSQVKQQVKSGPQIAKNHPWKWKWLCKFHSSFQVLTEVRPGQTQALVCVLCFRLESREG